MATITKSADAPAGVENFSVGNVDFTLNASNPKFVTEDQGVIGNARVNAWLDVEYDKPAVDPDAPAVDQNDPHNNPEADHLSAQASPAAKAAAAANQAAIADLVTGEQSVSAGAPPVAQAVADSLSIIGVTEKAEVPFAESPATTTPVEPVSSKEEDSPAVATTSSSSSSAADTTTSPAATPAASSSSSATPTTGATS